MCGIGGGVGLSADALESMLGSMQHRGPDSQGVQRDTVAVIGARRLAIIDVEGGDQPIDNEDGSVSVVANGEIYNYRELTAELARRGHRFRTRCDTEVIVHAYEEWGRRCFERLRGMFAVALYDRRPTSDTTLLLARDRLGIKPLYYSAGRTGLVFASEIRALLRSGLVSRKLDQLSLWEYLGYQSVHPPRTLVDGINMLPAGCWLAVRRSGSLADGCYWDPLTFVRRADPASQPFDMTHLRALLEESVALHLVSDVPVGIFLSGGVDSTTVLALACLAGASPHAFTVGFPPSMAAGDEREAARRVAAHYGVAHTEIILEERDVLDRIPGALAAFDHPSGDGVNTFLVAAAARELGFKVALSGLGGDEFFGGYPAASRLARYAPILAAWGTMPRGIRRAVGRTCAWLGGGSVTAAKAGAWLKGDGSLAELYPVTRQVFPVEQRGALLEDGWREASQRAEDPYESTLRGVWPREGGPPFGARISYAEVRTYLHDVLLRDTDQMSMAHGLEIRVPLLDHRLAETVWAMPEAAWRRNGAPKRLLAESLDGLLPRGADGRRKQGFALPFEAWLRGPLRSYAAARLGDAGLGGRRVFNARALSQLWRRFLEGHKGVSWSRVWLLVALEDWMDRNQVTA